MVTKNRAREVALYALEHGDRAALDTFGIVEEALKRYKRLVREESGGALDALGDIRAKFTPQELRTISRAAGLGEQAPPKVEIDFSGEELVIGFITDTHMCSVYYKPEFLTAAFEQFDKAGVTMLLHGGDLSEGMSDRPGHIYELTHLGYAAQKEYCVEQMKPWKKPMYLIDGNHDRWFIKKAGALIVSDVCDSIPNATFLGHDEGDLKVSGITIKLWHGEDGASYATSYRVQKIVEAFSGGEKPNVLLLGHDHKQIVMFERNVHAVAGGCLSTQSKWMRGKRLAAYPGFHIIRMVIGNTGVASFTTTWLPFYA